MVEAMGEDNGEICGKIENFETDIFDVVFVDNDRHLFPLIFCRNDMSEH